jgi:hypothetical protein
METFANNFILFKKLSQSSQQRMLEIRTKSPFNFEPISFLPKNCAVSSSEVAKTFSTRSSFSGKVSNFNGV